MKACPVRGDGAEQRLEEPAGDVALFLKNSRSSVRGGVLSFKYLEFSSHLNVGSSHLIFVRVTLFSSGGSQKLIKMTFRSIKMTCWSKKSSQFQRSHLNVPRSRLDFCVRASKREEGDSRRN